MSLSPGWYPDQEDGSYERYWNGVEWRDRRPRGAAQRWEADDAGAGGSPGAPAWNAEGSQPSLARGDAYGDAYDEAQGWNSQSSLARGEGLSKSRRRREPISTLIEGIVLIVIMLSVVCLLGFILFTAISDGSVGLNAGFAVLAGIALLSSAFLVIGIVNVVRWFSSHRRRR